MRSNRHRIPQAGISGSAGIARAWRAAVHCAVVLVMLGSCRAMGESPSGERKARMLASSRYNGSEFVNEIPSNLLDPGTFWSTLRQQLFGDETRWPPGELPVVPLNDHDWVTPPPPGLRVVWIGHATVLIEIDGVRLMTDPMFSERASPASWFGPERFHPTPISLEALPPIDAVVISHDHYDHLDMGTARFLVGRGTRFVVGLGIGAHLESWDIPRAQITELDWWESVNVGRVTVVATPARHYSGRGLFDQNETLWSSWAVIGPESRLYSSGDTGFSDHFARIGERFGPFDLTLIKIGAYGFSWLDIHMAPEAAIDAHLAIKGLRMVPVHWGTFNMAIHDWDEPIIRAVAEARAKRVDLVTPRVGEWVSATGEFRSAEWWKEVRTGK